MRTAKRHGSRKLGFSRRERQVLHSVDVNGAEIVVRRMCGGVHFTRSCLRTQTISHTAMENMAQPAHSDVMLVEIFVIARVAGHSLQHNPVLLQNVPVSSLQARLVEKPPHISCPSFDAAQPVEEDHTGTFVPGHQFPLLSMI